MFSELFAFTLPALSDSPHTAPRLGGRLPRLQNFYKQRAVETLAGFFFPLFIFQNTALHPVYECPQLGLCVLLGVQKLRACGFWLFMCVYFSVSPPLFTSMPREPFLPFGVCECVCVCVCVVFVDLWAALPPPGSVQRLTFPCVCVFVSLCTCLRLSQGCPETRVNYPSLMLLRLS